MGATDGLQSSTIRRGGSGPRRGTGRAERPAPGRSPGERTRRHSSRLGPPRDRRGGRLWPRRQIALRSSSVPATAFHRPWRSARSPFPAWKMRLLTRGGPGAFRGSPAGRSSCPRRRSSGRGGRSGGERRAQVAQLTCLADVVPGRIFPGQRTMNGTRWPPSQISLCMPRKSIADSCPFAPFGPPRCRS